MNPEEEQIKESPLKQIRTFQGDVAEALKKQDESLVSIQRAEHLKKDSSTESGEPRNTKKKSLLFLFGSVLLFTLGAVGAWYAYGEFIRKTITPIIDTPTNRFLSTNSVASLDFATTTTREMLINNLFNAVETTPPGETKHLSLIKIEGKENLLLSTSEFFNILRSQAPSSLIRSFDPSFMLGSLGEDSGTMGKSVFLIIKLVSFENAFAGMLLWEKDLNRNIGPIFTTAPLLKNIPDGQAFIDVTDRNKDIRALTFENKPVLLYSFYENNMLIITDSVETLRILVDRLTREKLLR